MYADQTGLAKIAARVAEPAPLLMRLAKENKTFREYDIERIEVRADSASPMLRQIFDSPARRHRLCAIPAAPRQISGEDHPAARILGIVRARPHFSRAPWSGRRMRSDVTYSASDVAFARIRAIAQSLIDRGLSAERPITQSSPATALNMRFWPLRRHVYRHTLCAHRTRVLARGQDFRQ